MLSTSSQLFPSLSLSIFCIVYVHRHWHVRINTQRERERQRQREKDTHTHTRTQTHTCAIGPKMHRLMKSSMRTHVCIIYINMYNIHIYTRILRCYSKFVGKLFYIIPTNWRNGKGSQTWPLAFWPAWQPRTGIQTQPRPPKAPADWLDGHLRMLSLNVRQKQETVLTRSLHKVLMFPFE